MKLVYKYGDINFPAETLQKRSTNLILQAKAELERLKIKMKDLVSYDKIEIVNLTSEFKLNKGDSKDSYAFSMEFPNYEACNDAEAQYKEEIEDYGLHFKMLDDKLAIKDILQEIPAQNHVCNSIPQAKEVKEDIWESDSDSDSDGEFDEKMRQYKTDEDFPENASSALKIRGFKFKQKADKKHAKAFLLREFQKKEAIGCATKCNECSLCTDPIRIITKKGKDLLCLYFLIFCLHRNIAFWQFLIQYFVYILDFCLQF